MSLPVCQAYSVGYTYQRRHQGYHSSTIQSTMTEWVWSGSLVAFARIVKQRTHEGAQEEAKELALLIKDEIDSVPELETSWLALLK